MYGHLLSTCVVLNSFIPAIIIVEWLSPQYPLGCHGHCGRQLRVSIKCMQDLEPSLHINTVVAQPWTQGVQDKSDKAVKKEGGNA
jgi:hypothetical protein